MKRIFALIFIALFLFSGCAPKDTQSEKETASISNTSYEIGTDGVLEPMSAEELIKKLSQLNEETTMAEVIEIFGKEPRIVMEASSNIWEYFCGDITIGLSGIAGSNDFLYDVSIAYEDSFIKLKLDKLAIG